jgi:hypothetical protein
LCFLKCALCGYGLVHLVREKDTAEEWAAKYLKVTDDASAQGDRMTCADIRNECEILKMMDHPAGGCTR